MNWHHTYNALEEADSFLVPLLIIFSIRSFIDYWVLKYSFKKSILLNFTAIFYLIVFLSLSFLSAFTNNTQDLGSSIWPLLIILFIIGFGTLFYPFEQYTSYQKYLLIINVIELVLGMILVGIGFWAITHNWP